MRQQRSRDKLFFNQQHEWESKANILEFQEEWLALFIHRHRFCFSQDTFAHIWWMRNREMAWKKMKSVCYLSTNRTVFASLHPFKNATEVEMVRTLCHNLRVLWCVFCKKSQKKSDAKLPSNALNEEGWKLSPSRHVGQTSSSSDVI